MKRIKKAFALLLTVCSLVLLLSTFAAADEYAPAVFKTTAFEAKQGEIVSTTLYVEENSNLIDFEFQLTYDEELVELQSAAQDSELLGDMEILQKDGAVHISYTRTSANLTKKTNLAVLTFRVKNNVGPSSYDFLKLDATYHSEAHTMKNDDLFALPIETDFAKLNIYNFGDINLSQSVSIADVTMLRQHLAEMRELTDYQLALANAYYDAEVSIADAVRIQQYLANKSLTLGNRVNVTFMDKENTFYRVKSVIFGESLAEIPTLPTYTGYYGGVWSLTPNSDTGASFQNLENSLTVYASYKKDASPAVTFYKERLTNVFYSQQELTGNLNLVGKLTYQDGYTADVYWSSSNSAVLNATTGAFKKPAYDSTVTLTATIISYLDNTIEAQDYISFEYTVSGEYLCPTKASIKAYLDTLFTNDIDTNLMLPGSITNDDISASSEFEVRLDWILRDTDGNDHSVVQLQRANNTQDVTLIATATFNGVPLEGDGKMYFDHVTILPVSKDEVRSYLITEIAAHTGVSVQNGYTFWSDDTKYGCEITWISQNHDVATIDGNNTITINDVVNGTSLPITVEATYTSGSKSETIKLSYTVSVVTDNTLLVPGTNIDPYLYNALKSATGVYGNLTTDALKYTKFVYLDLSAYPEIQDLSAITYCTNLRVLNISGLSLNETSLNQICTLTKLEALIANHCGISTFTTGGTPVLDKMINLKMLDLAYNNLTSLDSVFSDSNRYGQMEELYLNNNQLTDISALCERTTVARKFYDGNGEVISTVNETVDINRAPMLRFLILDNNHLNNDDLLAFSNFKVLKYLSLGNNDITSVSSLKDNQTLLELHLQGNEIRDVRDLRYLTHLQSLYLSDNNISNTFAGANEVNISYLRYLTDLEILYLDNNNIEDISDLATLNKLLVLNVNNNRIQDLSILADKGETLVELYAENNEIDSFSFVRNLTKLTRLMLSGNGSVYESTLSSYLGNLTSLKTLTLSGKDLRNLSFVSGMTGLIRLDVADCNLPAAYITSYSLDGTTLTAASYSDNIAAILSLKDSLKYLDVSNNGLSSGAVGIKKYLKNCGEEMNITSVVYSSGKPTSFDALYELTNLKLLYADNLAESVNAPHLFSIMTGIKYLSMENCGITDVGWLAKLRGLVYVDLAGNNPDEFDLGNYISTRSRGTLEYLYIDTNNEGCDFANAFATFDGNVLKEFSASNVQIGAMDNLPDMDSLTYLNLANSGITSLSGDNSDFDGWFNLSRYKKLERIDISGVQADIDELEDLDNLETVYAIGTANDVIFQKGNLLKLYALNQNGIECYLYDYDTPYEPSTQTEGREILDAMDDLSCTVTVAANNLISDNNPVLPTSVNGFEIEWEVSNNTNYCIEDNRLCVKSYNSIDDEDLTITASIAIYPNQGKASREFTIHTNILRASTTYQNITAENANSNLMRDAAFTYIVSCKAAPTEGFTENAAPVYTDVNYSYSAKLSSEESVPYNTILTVGDNNSYSIAHEAALGSYVTIHVEIGHTIGGQFVPDMSIDKQIHIAERTFELTYIANGGTVTSIVDGREIDSDKYVEDSELFNDILVSRTGYTFDGWYSDEGLQTAFTGMVMPMNDLTLYAKWNINHYNITFESNGGSEVETQNVPYHELAEIPNTPTRTNYRFLGWYTDEAFAAEWDSSKPVDSDMTIYAKWIYNEYTVIFDANKGTGGATTKFLYGSTVTAPNVNRTGYTLTGWYRDESCTTPWNVANSTVTSDITLYAGWTANSYDVTFNANGGTVAESSKSVMYADEYGTLPTPSKTGYIFNGWYSLETGGTKIEDTTKLSTASDHTLYAHWTIKTVVIPNFAGGTAAAAAEWCNDPEHGIKYTLSYAYDWQVASGYVRSNDYAGAVVDYGSTISINVSSGAKPITVGDYVWFDGGYMYRNGLGSGGVWKESSAQNGCLIVTDGYNNGYYGVRFNNGYSTTRYGWVKAELLHQHTN